MVQVSTHQPSRVYRGTVEEVFSHRNEIPPNATLELRVFEDVPEIPTSENGPNMKFEAAEQPKQLRGRGMLAGILSTEEFMRRKHEETAREDRPIR